MDLINAYHDDLIREVAHDRLVRQVLQANMDCYDSRPSRPSLGLMLKRLSGSRQPQPERVLQAASKSASSSPVSACCTAWPLTKIEL